jgi:hypothetical protein
MTPKNNNEIIAEIGAWMITLLIITAIINAIL